jgi:anaerobic selenocysteine-containing dehydrogenase
LAEIGVETAQSHTLKDGDAVWVETQTGRALFRLKVSVMREGVVSVEYGWWYPELSGSEFATMVLTSNANVLTHADFEACESLLGQWQFNGLPCQISLAGPGETAFLNDRNSYFETENDR